MEKKYGLRCPNVFHAGDGNLHPLILFDANDADQLHRTEQFGAEILEKCVEVGGTITGEHGVGVEKINQMCVQFRRAGARAVPRGEARVRPARPAQSRQGHPDARALRRVRRHARARRQAAASRAAALLIETLQERIREAAARRRAAAPARRRHQGLLRQRAARRDPRHARLRRHRRLRADRAGGHRALRHAARRARSDCSARTARCLPFEPPHFGAGATVGGCVAAGLSGPRRASGRRAARLRARREAGRRPRPGAAASAAR